MVPKKKPSAVTAESYLAALPEARRAEVARVHAIIRKTAPSLKVSVGSSMIGYGSFHYRYATGREGDAFRIGLACRANGISVYVLAFEDGGYVAERMASELGKVDVGRSCVRFKKVDDLELAAFKALLKKAVDVPAAGEVVARRAR